MSAGTAQLTVVDINSQNDSVPHQRMPGSSVPMPVDPPESNYASLAAFIGDEARTTGLEISNAAHLSCKFGAFIQQLSA